MAFHPGTTDHIHEKGAVLAGAEKDPHLVVTELVEARRAVKDREQRYRTLTTNIPGAVFRAAVVGRRPSMEFVSPRIEEITGYPASDFVSDRVRNYREVIHPDDAPNNEREVWRALERQEPYNIEYRILRADGGVSWVNERGSGTFAGNGALLWVDGVIFDVTERRRVGEALRESEARKAFLLKLGDAIRPLTNPVHIEGTVTRMLAEHLGATWSYYCTADEYTGIVEVKRDHAADGVRSLAGSYRLEDFWVTGDRTTFVAADVANDARMSPPFRDRVLALSVRAFVTTPLVNNGKLAAFFCVGHDSVRAWTPAEVALVEEVAERAWDAMERAHAEAALRASEGRLQLALEAAYMGTFLWHVEEDRTQPDARFLALFGLPPEGKISLAEALATMIHPDDTAGYADAVAAATDPKSDGELRAEIRVVHPDGAVRWLAITARTFFKGRPRRATRMSGVAADITDRKRAEEALRENAEWLRIAQRAARSGTWEWDLATGELRWSDEHRALFGFDAQTPVTRERWWATVHPEDLPRLEEAGRRCSEEGEEWPEVQYRIRAAGETRWVDARGRTARNRAGRPIRILGISVDVTQRKRAEEERDRLLAREWVAKAEAAERERISRELHDRVAHSIGVAHQSLQLHGILAGKDPARAAQKLDLAREMTKASLESTRNLSAELRRLEAEDGLEAELGHQLEVSVPPHVEATLRVEGDETAIPGHVRSQMFLVLREAVRNAVAHSGCASISVGLDVGPKEVVGSVQDDGRGFDAEKDRGGVGLRSMRERAALLNGTLDLTCRPGGGTRVEVVVPLGER